ncbi:MAG TPA: hypothetical protein VG755_28705 [Nannocystaceae bacterium]|nr:hypothetical protein [Nannocystaceae bacterium]
MALALAGLALGGCPASGTCPDCRYRTATVTASDVATWTAVKMDTEINHDASTEEDNCPIRGEPHPCISKKKDEPVLCRVTQGDGKAEVMLSIPSMEDAGHTVTLKITKGTTSQTLTTTTVATPISDSAPTTCTK